MNIWRLTHPLLCPRRERGLSRESNCRLLMFHWNVVQSFCVRPTTPGPGFKHESISIVLELSRERKKGKPSSRTQRLKRQHQIGDLPHTRLIVAIQHILWASRCVFVWRFLRLIPHRRINSFQREQRQQSVFFGMANKSARRQPLTGHWSCIGFACSRAFLASQANFQWSRAL